jgi:hypothetical protein
VAAVVIAITTGWTVQRGEYENESRERRALNTVLSLLMPLYLVGPLKRDTVHVAELVAAAQASDPEESLSRSAAEAAMSNDLRNLRLSNLLDAARRELGYALVLLLLWALLVPVSGVLRHEQSRDVLRCHCLRF